MTLQRQAPGPQQHLDPFRLARQQAIHQLVGCAELQPMAGQAISHSQTMTAVFGLVEIAWRPGAFQQHHMTGPVQGEAKGTGAEGGQQTIVLTLLKPIHTLLAFSRALATCQQLAAKGLLQQLQWGHKATEQHHRLALPAQ